MTTGTIKRLVQDKGFGFIAADDGTEYFFHRSAVDGQGFEELREGDPVQFEAEPVAQSPKGPRARRVARATAATASASGATGAARVETNG